MKDHEGRDKPASSPLNRIQVVEGDFLAQALDRHGEAALIHAAVV
jgi:hypothetical protein